jgi:hypothetical protein
MANKWTPRKGSQQPQPNDDKVCIVLPRRLVRTFTYVSTHIAVPITLYSFMPYLPSPQPKQVQCSQPQTAQVLPHRDKLVIK